MEFEIHLSEDYYIWAKKKGVSGISVLLLLDGEGDFFFWEKKKRHDTRKKLKQFLWGKRCRENVGC